MFVSVVDVKPVVQSAGLRGARTLHHADVHADAESLAVMYWLLLFDRRLYVAAQRPGRLHAVA